jgi:hypothetical protein
VAGISEPLIEGSLVPGKVPSQRPPPTGHAHRHSRLTGRIITSPVGNFPSNIYCFSFFCPLSVGFFSSHVGHLCLIRSSPGQ